MSGLKLARVAPITISDSQSMSASGSLEDQCHIVAPSGRNMHMNLNFKDNTCRHSVCLLAAYSVSQCMLLACCLLSTSGAQVTVFMNRPRLESRYRHSKILLREPVAHMFVWGLLTHVH